MDDLRDKDARGARQQVQPSQRVAASDRGLGIYAFTTAIDFDWPLEDEGFGDQRSEISDDMEEPVDRPSGRYVAETTKLRDYAALTDPTQ